MGGHDGGPTFLHKSVDVVQNGLAVFGIEVAGGLVG